jgi:hypothetical protein
MKFFWRSKDKSTPIAERKKEQLPFKIAMTGVNYEGDLFQCDVALKIWLPESIHGSIMISASDFNKFDAFPGEIRIDDDEELNEFLKFAEHRLLDIADIETTSILSFCERKRVPDYPYYVMHHNDWSKV